MSRINWGHTPALFLIALGYYLYLMGRMKRRAWLGLAGGLATGISAYGYPGFYGATIVFVGLVVISEIAWMRWPIRRYLVLWTFAALLCYVPIVYEGRTNPEFDNRFNEKDPAGYGLVSWQRAESMIKSYPKYYTYDYLFAKGEIDLPGGAELRHSVRGAGLFSRLALPFLVIGVLAFIFVRGDERKRGVTPFFLLVLAFPLPDLVTTTVATRPYTFAVFTGILWFPFVLAYGLDTLFRFLHARPRWTSEPAAVDGENGLPRAATSAQERSPALAPVSGGAGDDVKETRGGLPDGREGWRAAGNYFLAPRVIGVVTVAFGLLFFAGTYQAYNVISAGYWGWQSGPEEMIAYYLDHEAEYDAFYMDGAFNQPGVFLDFYIQDADLRAKASIGGLDQLDPTRRQLFGVSRDFFQTIPNPEDFRVLSTIRYPDGSDAFYMVERAPV
jgi:hypothetical protein